MVLFFGPPGSGKSVQGQLLVSRNGWSWLSTGQLFRQSSDREVLDRLASGELIDDELTNKVLSQALKETRDKKHVVLDGYPRTLKQAQWLEGHLPQHGREIATIIVFEVPREELMRRLSTRGRAEDAAEVIEKRLKIFHHETKPVLDYYKSRGVPIQTIDGHGTVGTVHDRIQRAVEECSLV